MLRRHRILVVAAATLSGWLLTASAASAQAPGGVGGGGSMFAILGLPSVGDILQKIVKNVFGALAKALLPDFVREAPDKLVTWLATLPNPTAHGTNVHELMTTTRATGVAFLAIVLLQGVVRGMIPGEHDHPITVLSRVVGVGAFLALYEWLFANGIALFNTISAGLLHNRVVADGMKATVETTFSVDAITGPLPGLLVLFALLALIGLLLVKIMLLYLLPLVFVAWPLVAPLSVPRETAHIPKTLGVMFGTLCAIPAGWALLFGVAGALASDMDAGRVEGAGFLASGLLAPLTTIGVFALAVWWPFALLGMAKALPGQLGFTATKGPVARAGSAGGTLAKLKLASMVASGGIGAIAGAKAGAAARGPRLAADAAGGARRRAAAGHTPLPAGVTAGPGAARGGGVAGAAAPATATTDARDEPPHHGGRWSSAVADASPAAAERAEAAPSAAAASSAVAEGGDPLRPSSAASTPADAPPAAGASPAARSRDAAAPRQSQTPASLPPAPAPVRAPGGSAAANRPSEAPAGPAERPSAPPRPDAAPRPAAPAQTPPTRPDPAHHSEGRSATPPSLQTPSDARPASAPERLREASAVPPSPPPARSQSVGGLPAASQAQDSAREAFGKEQS